MGFHFYFVLFFSALLCSFPLYAQETEKSSSKEALDFSSSVIEGVNKKAKEKASLLDQSAKQDADHLYNKRLLFKETIQEDVNDLPYVH